MNVKIPIFGIAILLIIISGAFGIYVIESQVQDSEIDTLLDAFWWSAATITTVGFGDIVPISDAGKIFGIFYMFFGIAAVMIFLGISKKRIFQLSKNIDEELSDENKILFKKIEELEKKQKQTFETLQDLVKKLDENNKE